jgi:hypothetical protein
MNGFVELDRAAAFRDYMLRAMQIADAAVVTLIEIECRFETHPSGTRWYDTRPLLDVREFSGPLVDLHQQHITHGVERQLLIRHPAPDLTHLVRVVRRRSTT